MSFIDFCYYLNPFTHSLVSEEGLYALKKVFIQTEDQFELVKKEIDVSSLFNHPNLLPLLDHAIISTRVMITVLESSDFFLLIARLFLLVIQ